MKRLIIVCGHYGAGKTNFAVNLALRMAGEGKKTAIVDFDIVNPYFRAADSVKKLREHGVRCILPEYANSNVDLPSLPAEIYSVFQNPEEYAVFDVGGDDAGAVALGTYHENFEACGYDMLYVCNMYRPLTASPKEALSVMREIEAASRLRCTALVNNSNLGEETTWEAVAASLPYAEELSRQAELPLLCTSTVCPAEGDAIFHITDETKKYWRE